MILLDTHALIWWADGDRLRLSANALAAIDEAIECAGRPGGSPGLLVSAISCWEVAMLVNRGRLALSLDVEVGWRCCHPIRRCGCWPWIPP